MSDKELVNDTNHARELLEKQVQELLKIREQWQSTLQKMRDFAAKLQREAQQFEEREILKRMELTQRIDKWSEVSSDMLRRIEALEGSFVEFHKRLSEQEK